MNKESDENVSRLEIFPGFASMPQQIRQWIQASPQATADFSDFFDKGGIIRTSATVKYAEYVATEPPVMRVNEESWGKALAPDAMAWPQRRMMGVLAHEIGHGEFNTGSPLFKGGPPEDYVKYRAELESQATFNAFTIFRDLARLPEFKTDLPYGSMGYLADIEIGKFYGDWKSGKVDQAQTVEAMADRMPNCPYSLGNPPHDLDGDGRVTHRDAYLRDYQQVIKQHPHLAQRPEDREQPEAERNQRSGPNSAEPGGLSRADEALMEQLRGQVSELDKKADKDWDDNSERIAASALVMAKEMGTQSGDDLRLAFNKPAGQNADGTILHLARGGTNASNDPAANRAMMPTQEALSQSPQERFQQVEAIGQAQAEQQRLAQQEALKKAPDDPDKGGPKFTM